MKKKKKNLLKSHQKSQNQNLRIKLTKKVKDLYTENYKTLMKEMNEASKKWKDSPILFIPTPGLSRSNP